MNDEITNDDVVVEPTGDDTAATPVVPTDDSEATEEVVAGADEVKKVLEEGDVAEEVAPEADSEVAAEDAETTPEAPVAE